MKRICSLLLALTLLVSTTTGVYASNNKNDKNNNDKQTFSIRDNKNDKYDKKDRNEKGYKNEDKAQALYDLGLFKGTSSAAYVPALGNYATRAEALVLIGNALGWPKTEVTTVPGYSDVPAWAASYVAYALENNITKGVGDQKFGANLPVNQRMIYTWYYRALLFSEDSWKNSDFLVSAGLITQDQATQMKAELTGLTDSAAIRDTIVGIMFESMQWKEKGSNQRLIQRLIHNNRVDWKKAKDHGFEPDSEELTFNVKANSLKAITVEFSEELKSSTVTGASFDVKVDGVDKTFGTDYTIETINKTVYIIFNNLLTQASTVSVGVKEGIESVDGSDVKMETKSVVVNDSMLPVVKSVDVVNPTTFKIFFSEPMNLVTGTLTHEDILIDGIKAIGTSSLNASKTVLTFELATAVSGGDHVLQINSGLTDFIGLKTVQFAKTFNLSLDTTSPAIVSVKAVERDHIVIQFNEAINKSEGLIIVGQTQYPVTAATINGSVVELPLSVPLTIESAVVGTLITIKGIKDLSNNAVDSTVGTQFVFKANSDTTVPTATVKVLANKTIEVQFSESIDAFNLEDYTLVNGTNVVVASSVIYNRTDKKAFITFTTAPVDGVYTLSIFNTVLDNSVYQNKFEAKSFQVSVNN